MRPRSRAISPRRGSSRERERIVIARLLRCRRPARFSVSGGENATVLARNFAALRKLALARAHLHRSAPSMSSPGPLFRLRR